MPSINACLLDYGNTIIEFDRPQIEFILEHLRAFLCARVGSVDTGTLREVTERAHALPHAGDPPDYRELLPVDQMRYVLREIYGSERALPETLVALCNDRLQDLFVESITMDAGILDALHDLKSRVPIGIISNYPCGEAIRRSLRGLRIDGLFKPVVVSGDVGYVKPHARPFTRALDALGAAPEEVLYVGDRWDLDMVGAHRSGLRTCHHVGLTSTRGWERLYAQYKPDHVIRHLRDLCVVLDAEGE